MKTGETVNIPERRFLTLAKGGNRIVQVAAPAVTAVVGLPIADGSGKEIGFDIPFEGHSVALVMDGPPHADGYGLVLGYNAAERAAGDFSRPRWMSDAAKPLKVQDEEDRNARQATAAASWLGNVSLREEVRGTGGNPGLRPPQIGGVYGVLSHWKAYDGAATVVMPTGTGKTETMLTLLVHERFRRLLVLVPSDALREQIGRKFETLGKLRELGVLGPGALNPVVGRMGRKPKNDTETRDFLASCNVVVSTVQALTGLDDDVKRMLAEAFDVLFIDEAHHVAAATWAEIRDLFAGGEGKRVVQFTATPFREDGKLVDGKVVFRFPMRKAMQQGYFTKIRFLPVDSDDEANIDRDIATTALSRLREDLALGLDHVIMARTRSIKRAVEVLEIYRRLAPEFSPCCVHSKLRKGGVAEAKEALSSRQTRIIVCVDMLGEGFDFPNLKIAALHDPHRSLAVTLQFVGRFTRDDRTAGEATAVASLADPRMDDRIQALYAEDADWNVLLDRLSEEQTGKAVARSEFLDGFGTEDDDLVSMRQIFPKMSTTIFRTKADGWKPHRMEAGLGSARTVRMARYNPTFSCVLAITEESEAVPWGSTKLVTNTLWHLFLAFWDEETRLLFINTSDHSTSLSALAEALTGSTADPVESEDVFKAFYGVHRMTLLNVGLRSRANRFTRFRMLVGPDVAEGMSKASLSGSSKTNVFVTGREGGLKVTLGASAKGRIWSYSTAFDMGEWVKWCRRIGKKVRDPAINRETVLEGALIPTVINTRPNLVPLSVEWPDTLLARSEDSVTLNIGSGYQSILDADLVPVANSPTDPLRFILKVEAAEREFEVRFSGSDASAKFVQLDGETVYVKVGKNSMRLGDWFGDNPPCFLFPDLSELEGNLLFATRHPVAPDPLPDSQVLAWHWPPIVDIKKESLRRYKGTAIPVQKHVLNTIQTTSWSSASGFSYDVVFDDDGSGEVADIVALGSTVDALHVDYFHCKFSESSTPSARVGDLYEVCGQASRTVRWIGYAAKLAARLEKREYDALRSAGGTRFILGDRRLLRRFGKLANERRVICRVFAVQPGLSKNSISGEANVADILASVDTYLRQSVEIGLQVICSP